MKLEICHPNDFLKNRWIFVEDVDQDWIDHIRSPSFEWYRGLMVRIDGVYQGIYSDTECVDVGSRSAVMLSLTPTNDEQFMFNKFCRSCSLPDAWKTSIEPDAMIYFAHKILSRHRVIVVITQCLRYAIQSHNRHHLLMWDALDALDTQSSTECIPMRQRIQSELNAGSPRNPDVRQILYALEDVLSFVGYSSVYRNAVNAYDPINRIADIRNLMIGRIKFAEMIRNSVPFHEIAEALAK